MMTAYSHNANATIAAIRKYDDMRLIVDKTPIDIKDKYDSLASPGSQIIDGMPHRHNPHAGEEHLVEMLDIIGEMNKRYETATVFLQWFEPMWNSLSGNERQILETYKFSGISSSMVDEAVTATYSIRQLHRARQKALSRLEFLLFGE